MRVGHTIEESTLLAYGVYTSQSGGNNEPEKASLQVDLLPSLSELCAQRLPPALIPVLPGPTRNYMLETLSTSIPLQIATKIIPDGIYWKRRFEKRWGKRKNVLEADGDWRRFYLEKHCQQVVENLSPDSYAEEEMERLCEVASNFVHKLELRELQIQSRLLDPKMEEEDEEQETAPRPPRLPRDRINLKPLVAGLHNLVQLHIHFSVTNVGSNYTEALYKFTSQDCKNLGNGIAESSTLRVLRIHQSSLDDAKLGILVAHMRGNTSLQALQFPHCHIADEGAAALAKFLSDGPKLRRLDLSNNRIKSMGIKALSFVLTQQCGLMDLNISLNGVGDEGAQFLLSALQRQAPALRVLNISCAGLGEDTGILLGQVLARNKCLMDVNVSNNALGPHAGSALVQGMRQNVHLQFCDLRMTALTNQDQLTMETLLHANRCREGQPKYEMME